MTTLTIIASTDRAGRRTIRRLDNLHTPPLPVHDAAIVDWPEGQDRPDAWQVRPFDTSRALSGSFWGLLFAHLFLLPISYQPALGEQPPSALEPDPTTTSLAHLGLGPDRLGTLRAAARPGTTAAFLLHVDGQDSTLELAFPREEFASMIIRLTADEQRRLYAGFGESHEHAV